MCGILHLISTDNINSKLSDIFYMKFFFLTFRMSTSWVCQRSIQSTLFQVTKMYDNFNFKTVYTYITPQISRIDKNAIVNVIVYIINHHRKMLNKVQFPFRQLVQSEKQHTSTDITNDERKHPLLVLINYSDSLLPTSCSRLSLLAFRKSSEMLHNIKKWSAFTLWEFP